MAWKMIPLNSPHQQRQLQYRKCPIRSFRCVCTYPSYLTLEIDLAPKEGNVPFIPSVKGLLQKDFVVLYFMLNDKWFFFFMLFPPVPESKSVRHIRIIPTF